MSNWKGVRQPLINAAADILAADSAEKLADMNRIRDRFLSDFDGTAAIFNGARKCHQSSRMFSARVRTRGFVVVYSYCMHSY
jgi:hypothetical protein